MDIKALVLFAGITCCSQAAWAEDCYLSRYSVYFGSDGSATMTVKSGQTCDEPIYSGGPRIHSLTISSPAKNGTAFTNGNDLAYRSKPGFTRSDRFVVTLTSFLGTSHLTVDVNVTR
jgi:hypothetical protein